MLNLKAQAEKQMEETAGPQMAWLRAIRDVLPDNGLFVDEFTQVGYVSRVGFPGLQPEVYDNSGISGNTRVWLRNGPWRQSSPSG
jgi:acetolactate synthase-1/2/3 large subunit